jgi:hypothetical protein
MLTKKEIVGCMKMMGGGGEILLSWKEKSEKFSLFFAASL